MGIEDVDKKWILKQKNKNAVIEMWDSMAESFGENEIPTFEKDSFLKLIEKNNMIDINSTVLDVGCGAGNYSLAMANRCKKIVAIDLSPKMIKIAKEKAKNKNISNVKFYCDDWDEMNLDKFGLNKQFDFVFAHMTPAIKSADTFNKLIQASRGWCALSKPFRRTDQVSDTIKKLVNIDEKRESCDKDIQYMFELLWNKGLLPKFEYEKTQWNMKKTLKEAYVLYINRMKTYKDLSPQEEVKIINYLKSICKNDFVYENVDTMITTIYWDNREEK